jgi:hypothetical protein
VVSLLLAGPAVAQYNLEASTKSESIAFLASFGCTVVPVIAGAAIIGDPDQASTTERIVGGTLGIAGWLAGPGMGHVYAGNDQAFGTGFAIRLVGFTAVMMGATSAGDDWGFGDNSADVGVLLLLGGSLVVVSAAVADIIRAPVLVHQEKRTPHLPVARRFELQLTGTGLAMRLHL